MNQTARYIIMVLLIIALGIWSITVYRSCQATNDPPEPVEETTLDEDDGNLEDLYSTEEDTTADEYVEETPTTIDDEEEEKPAGGYSDPAPSFDNEGEFLVIAGAFISEANAKKTVNRLQKKGYDDAEIRVFIGSEYHSAIVGAFEDMDDAFDVAIKLADEGYKDIYVHKKRHRKKR